MGASSYVLKDLVRGNEEMCNSSSESFWDNVLKDQAKRTRQGEKIQKRVVNAQNGGHLIRNRRQRTRCLKKRREPRKQGSATGIVRRIKTLKKLVPNSESMGVDGLFKETSAYILSLQMKVQIMHVMVKELTGFDD